MNRRLKKPVIYAGYALGVILFIGLIYLIEVSISKTLFKPENDDFDYVSKTIFEDDVPVINVSDVIIKPYNNEGVKKVKGFYDYKAESDKQINAIIYNSNTYFQNSGIDYSGVEKFEVVAVLEGTVIAVKNDKLLGNIIEIKHGSDIITTYQSLSEVLVKKDDVVKQGAIIGKSGVSNFSKDLGDHLHFEFIYKGQTVNPEEYYDKQIKDL